MSGSKEVFKLSISVHDDGSVNLSGPLENKVLCMGILECAKDAVREFQHGKQIKEELKRLEVQNKALLKVGAAVGGASR